MALIDQKAQTLAVETLRSLADYIESGHLGVADFGAIHMRPVQSPVVQPTNVSIDIGIYFLTEIGERFVGRISRQA